MEKANPFGHLLTDLQIEGHSYKYYSLLGLKDERVTEWQRPFPWDDEITKVNK